MVDRQVIYVGQIPQDTDLLLTNKNTMIGLGYLMQAVLGTATVVDGLACTPNSPAALNVLVGPGSIYSLEEVDATAYGSLAADTSDQIVKQGIIMSTQTFSCPAPSTSGFSVVYLIEAAYQDVDTGSTVLPYYNASNPSQAYSGPNNTGISQSTIRQGLCKIQVKTGVAAATGTQVTPSPDAGFTGLYAVTVANGQSTITSGNIVQLTTAPFINPKLTGIISAAQSGSFAFAHDTSGAANTITITLSPAPTSLPDGMRVWVKVANTTTGATVMNTNALGNVSVVTPAGSSLGNAAFQANGVYALTYDGNGTRWIYDGSGNNTASLPENSITGTNHTFASADQGSLIQRSNSGTAMSDTLPGTSGALPNGWFSYVKNIDATAADVIGIGSGGTINQGNLTGSIIILPGETWLIQSQGGGTYNAGRIHSAILHAAPTNSSFKNLQASWASNTTVSISADELVLEDSNKNTRRITSYSQTLNSATSGAGGLDTGALAGSTWYFIYAIFNPSTNTQSVLMSTSATTPTLPSGYTFASGPLSAAYTDGSNHFLGFTQKGRDWQYRLGSNLAAMPILISGSSGNVSTPTWTAVAVGTACPTAVASKIKLVLSGGGDTCMAAPNNSYGAATSTSNPPPLMQNANNRVCIIGEFLLESTNIYYASNAAGSNDVLACMGFTINI